MNDEATDKNKIIIYNKFNLNSFQTPQVTQKINYLFYKLLN